MNNPAVLVEIIRLIPNLLWVLLVGIVIAVFYNPVRRELLPKLTGINAFGIEIVFVQELDKAMGKWGVNVSSEDRKQVLTRAQRLASLLKGAQILWVDDRADQTAFEQQMLRSVGMNLDVANTSADAKSLLARKQYDVVVSDIVRNGVKGEGIQFLKDTHQTKHTQHIYVGKFNPDKGTPPYAFGITDRPDQLLHFVMDIMERKQS